MSRSVLSLLILAVSAELAPAAPSPKDAPKPVLYFPTTLGDSWVVANGETVFQSCVITEVEKRDGVTRVTVSETLQDGKLRRSFTYDVSEKGVTAVAGGGEMLPNPDVLIQFPATPGTKWERAIVGGNAKPRGTSVRTVIGEEEVETPAGKFKAVRVDTEYPAGVHFCKDWYAPGRGKVKTDFQGTVFLLKSFTPGK